MFGKMSRVVVPLICVLFIQPVFGQQVDGPVAPITVEDPKQYPVGPDGILARVGEQQVTKTSVDEMIVRLRSTVAPSPNNPDKALSSTALDLRILQAVVIEQARVAKIDLTKQELDAELSRLAKKPKSGPSDLDRLKIGGWTDEAIQEACKNRLLTRKLLESEVTEGKLESFFSSNRRKYVRQIRVAHIVVRVTKKRSRSEAQTRANRLLRELKAGADWVALARQESDDAMSAFDAGDLGWIYPDQQRQSSLFVKASKLGVGEVSSKVMALGNSFHIVKLMNERIPPVKYQDFPSKPLVRRDFYERSVMSSQLKWVKALKIVRYQGATAPTPLFPTRAAQIRKSARQSSENAAKTKKANPADSKTSSNDK